MDPRPKQTKAQGPSPAELLAKMPRRPLSVEQQAVALEKVQQQATQRVKLGQQLFEAADARLKQHQKILDEINGQQKILREQVQDDVAKSLQSYDQWMGRIDESFTKSIRDMTQRLDQLEERVANSQYEMQDMLAKAAALDAADASTACRDTRRCRRDRARPCRYQQMNRTAVIWMGSPHRFSPD